MTTEPAWEKLAAELAAEIARHPELAANPELAEDDPDDPQRDWPTDMILAFWAKQHGLDWLRALVYHCHFTVERLEEIAAELDKRNLTHVADVVMEFAKDARSEIDDVIAEAERDKMGRPRRLCAYEGQELGEKPRPQDRQILRINRHGIRPRGMVSD